MISLVVFDHAEMKKIIAMNEPELSQQKTTFRSLQSRRKRRIALRSRFSKIDSFRRLAWNNTSPKQLEHAEAQLLSILKTKFDGRYVPIMNNRINIWTIFSNVNSDNTPIVLLHGFGGGVGLWSLNLDHLSCERPVYAIDLPGFGRSSRPIFSLDHEEAENQIIDMIEEWRKEIGLDRQFILLGHSFGGFLSSSYALKYPKYVKQLVLIDSWGIAQRPDDIWQTGRLQRVPVWLRSFSSVMMKMSPLTGLRAAGPLGVPVIKYFRGDLRTKFEKLFNDDRILIYLYHCNAQLPTGEQAFRTISDCFAWAKDPMINRIHSLDERIPIYFLYGEQSWLTADASLAIQEKRPNVFVETVKNAGHHIYADAPVEFEMYLKKILCNKE
ncbi:unnamed protein product [Adineta ricciae]|uniref:AB hydrolase-1 domain-containing protein n=1 Tax=Adineta ricciae TaxID=249248 RepID=A0A813RTY4_ADIRI|nr:unnamed protein product [Adineta ricciae]CAF0887616.1 unnamed protein product [Adineta ricciae]